MISNNVKCVNKQSVQKMYKAFFIRVKLYSNKSVIFPRTMHCILYIAFHGVLTCVQPGCKLRQAIIAVTLVTLKNAP